MVKIINFFNLFYGFAQVLIEFTRLNVIFCSSLVDFEYGASKTGEPVVLILSGFMFTEHCLVLFFSFYASDCHD